MIANNAGVEGSIVIQEVKKGKDDYGFNAQTGEYENLIKSGVIDPTKVTKAALSNAASIAGLLLTTETIITEKKEEKEKVGHGHPGHGGGMGGGGMGDMY